jgi:hypothetical protein
MSIALMIGANPAKSMGGPVVRLIPGVYALHVEGLVDSELALNMLEQQIMITKEEKEWRVCVENSCDTQLSFKKRGTESHINVFATRQ